MTTTAINYHELCAYVAANAHRLPPIVNSILISWGELEAPSADTLEQARIEATDVLIEEFCEKLGILEGEVILHPNICYGQPDNALCWKMRGWN